MQTSVDPSDAIHPVTEGTCHALVQLRNIKECPYWEASSAVQTDVEKVAPPRRIRLHDVVVRGADVGVWYTARVESIRIVPEIYRTLRFDGLRWILMST